LHSSKVTKVLKDPDGTMKLQITLEDETAIETVLLIDKANRKTACVSCQVGCAMKCAFCKTGTLGCKRNLTASEIIEQFMFLEKEAGTLDNIVFMGMGEPMQNIEEIRKALLILSHKDGRALSLRRVTISTCGIAKGIYDLADNGPAVRLAVSLTTADEELRTTLMPVNKAYPLSELKKAIKYYIEKTNKRVTLEAALLHDKNTGLNSAKRLVEFARDMDVHINLIPWNAVEGLPFTRPTQEECSTFVSYLEQNGLNVTLRTKRGTSVNAACGQLGKA
jgi:23S rRNA (adenine2503-C2)-methyltransferase